MPIYEYDCPKCGAFEYSQSIKDKALARCPRCRSKVTKLISQTSFVLKGSGWYADSYQSKASSGSTGAASTDSGGDTTDSAKAEGKTEGKAEAKAEPKPKAKPAKPKASAASPSASTD